MNLLSIDICCNPQLNPIWVIVGTIVKGIWIGVPILLIIFGMIDLGKAVIASKEDEVKKATKAFGKRFLYAVGVFLVVWAVTLVLSLVLGLFDKNVTYDEDNPAWGVCWQKIIGNPDAVDKNPDWCPSGN